MAVLTEATTAFYDLKAAITRACNGQDVVLLFPEAKRHGLFRGDSPPEGMRLGFEVERSWKDRATLRLALRSYDQSRSFQTRPDMNIITLVLTDNGVRVAEREGRFES